MLKAAALSSLKRVGFLSLLCVGVTLSAMADEQFPLTISQAAGVSTSCKSGLAGTFDINSSGGIFVAAPSGSTTGCYVGALNSQASGTPQITTFISGLNTEGTAAQLFALQTGWYAEYGEICGGSGQCTGANNMTNGSNSGDIEVLVNSTSTSQTFTTYDSSGNANTPGNNAPAGCTYSGTLFTVSAHTICFEDLSTSGSIAMTINTSPVPEPTNVAFVGVALLAIAALISRKRQAKARA
jgi:hypothetical protein